MVCRLLISLRQSTKYLEKRLTVKLASEEYELKSALRKGMSASARLFRIEKGLGS